MDWAVPLIVEEIDVTNSSAIRRQVCYLVGPRLPIQRYLAKWIKGELLTRCLLLCWVCVHDDDGQLVDETDDDSLYL
jgi:hypothetical protein